MVVEKYKLVWGEISKKISIVKEREAREEREARSTPAYGRCVSVRAVTGALFSFLVCGPYRFLFTDPSTVALSEL
ncbi:hypothetical protein YC2023_106667 [Brassica napus]